MADKKATDNMAPPPTAPPSFEEAMAAKEATGNKNDAFKVTFFQRIEINGITQQGNNYIV